MPRFFIDRPIFAWVIALFIIMAGVLAIPNLPVAQYPSVAPPQITMATIFKSAVPFIAIQATCNALCIVFPQIVLWLPSKLYAGH